MWPPVFWARGGFPCRLDRQVAAAQGARISIAKLACITHMQTRRQLFGVHCRATICRMAGDSLDECSNANHDVRPPAAYKAPLAYANDATPPWLPQYDGVSVRRLDHCAVP